MREKVFSFLAGVALMYGNRAMALPKGEYGLVISGAEPERVV